MKRYLSVLSKEQKNIIKISFLFTLVISCLLFALSFVLPFSCFNAVAFLIGGLTSIFCFYLLIYKTVVSANSMLRKTIKFLHVIRMIIYVGIAIGLYFLFNQEKLIIISVFLSYLILKIVIICKYGFVKK